MKYDLSILIPARNEQFLARTVEDIMRNIRGNTEVIVVLDGQWADPPLTDNDRLTIIDNHESIGQRAATNQACRLSRAKYIMKVDAHCAFDEGFDVKMIAEMQDDYTMVPIMYNLHAFDWACTVCKERIYQGPTPKECPKCKGKMIKDILWQPRRNRESIFYRFDTTLHFQYHGDRKKTPANEGHLVETLSLQGSCFMLTRDKYWELNICDEGFGSWGQQGTEVACKTWLSGGKVLVNKKTWYAHMFRTQGGDFGFPYPLSGRAVDHARKYSRELFMNNTWDKQIHPLSWLIEKFKPLPDWHEDKGKKVLDEVNVKGLEFYAKRPVNKWKQMFAQNILELKAPIFEPSKGIIYFTDNQLNLKIAHKVQNQLRNIGLPITSASLKPMPHFGTNVHLPLVRGYTTMFKQILAALEASKSEIVFFCEHDVLYHPSHFEFTPKERNVFYYNINVWKVRVNDGHALWVNNCVQVSGLCGYREELIKHYKERVSLAESGPWDRNWGYEPGTPGKTVFKTLYTQETWMSQYPNIDIRHDHNLTLNRWSKTLFRDKKNCEGWTEKKVSELPGWNLTKVI